MIGEKVRHHRYGLGTVKESINRGFFLVVEFEDGITRRVRQDEISKENKIESKYKIRDIVFHENFGEGEVQSIEPYNYNEQKTFLLYVNFQNFGLKKFVESITKLTKIRKTSIGFPFSSEKFKSRFIIESLRLGIVPYEYVEELTLGRNNEIGQIRKWLEDKEQKILSIIGEYGSGKTHLIQYAIYQALKTGFATAWIEIDPNESPFHRPKRVYSYMIKNFRFLGEDSKIKNFRDFLLESFNHYDFKNNFYLKHLFYNREQEMFWSWIEGSEALIRPVEWYDTGWGYQLNKYRYVPGLYDYTNSANIYCYLLSTFGWIASNILRLKGLILFFDEAETLEFYNQSNYFERGLNFLISLIRTANNDFQLTKNPSESGLVYTKVGESYKIPFIYKIPTNLKLLFGFTSLDWNFRYNPDWIDESKVPIIEEFYESPQIILKSVDRGSLYALFRKISDYYTKAYDISFSDPEILSIFKTLLSKLSDNGLSRLFVKGAVEILDLKRFKLI